MLLAVHQDAARPYFGSWVSLVLKSLEILGLYLNSCFYVKVSSQAVTLGKSLGG